MATHSNPKTQNIIDTLSANEAFINELKTAFQTQVAECGDASFARFVQAITEIARDEVKPAVKAARATAPIQRAGSENVDNAWRADQKALFSGRGNQWIKVSIDDVQPSLSLFQGLGIDVDDYTRWTNNAGYAWVRYSGPRINDGEPSAAFEVRVGGSKIDHPKQLFYMPHDLAMCITSDDRLPNTPYALGLEMVSNNTNDDDDVDAVDAVEEAVEA